jgi:hypothetical protein
MSTMGIMGWLVRMMLVSSDSFLQVVVRVDRHVAALAKVNILLPDQKGFCKVLR